MFHMAWEGNGKQMKAVLKSAKAQPAVVLIADPST